MANSKQVGSTIISQTFTTKPLNTRYDYSCSHLGPILGVAFGTQVREIERKNKCCIIKLEWT